MILTDQIQSNIPNTSAALEKLGLSGPSTEQILKNNRLDEASNLERLALLVEFASSDALKLQAIKLAMDAVEKAKMKSGDGEKNTVTIIIHDPTMAGKINPILFPRTKAPVVDLSPVE
jgi:Tfp pilus assembly protein FimT